MPDSDGCNFLDGLTCIDGTCIGISDPPGDTDDATDATGDADTSGGSTTGGTEPFGDAEPIDDAEPVYVPDVACGFGSLVPYFYFFYFAPLLIDRERRDHAMCKRKYGADWDRYCEKVRYRIIPFVY